MQHAPAYSLLIKRLLAAPLAHSADQEIVYRDQRRHSYAEFGRRVSRLGNVLTGLGIGIGDRIAMFDWDSHRYLECYFAVPMLGAALQTVNVRLSPEQIHYTLRDVGARVIIVHTDFLPLVAALRDRLDWIEAIIVIDDDAAPCDRPLGTVGEYEALLDAAPDGFDFPDFDEQVIATTFHTSGTSGNPKAVHFSHRQLVLHTLAGMAALGTSHPGQSFHMGDVYMPLTPMFHVHAWGLPFMATAMGVLQVYPGRYDPQMLLDLRERHGVTLSHGVPTVLHMLLDAAEGRGTDLSGWKMIVGGSPLPAALQQRAARTGLTVFTGYGMSESCPLLTVSRLRPDRGDKIGEAPAALRAAGLPIPLVELAILGDDGQPQPHDGETVGELVARAPWLTDSYAGNAEASAALWDGGWMHTQDVASIDPDGTVRIRDRAKDLVKSGGEWISSAALEDLIAGCDGVKEVAVIATPHEKWGERPRAVLVAEGSCCQIELSAAIASAVSDAIECGKISRYAAPDLAWTTQLPRTSVGKIDKKRLREEFAG